MTRSGETLGEAPQAVRRERIRRRRRRQRAHVGVEVVNAAHAAGEDVFEAIAAEDDGAAAVAGEGEGLPARSHGHLPGAGARGGVEGPGSVAAGRDGEGAGGCQEGDDEDGVRHRVVAVGLAGEVVGVGRRARPGLLAGVGRVAGGGLEGRAVPVD